MNQKEYELIAAAIHRTVTISSLERNKVKREARYAALRLLIADLTGTLAHEYKPFDIDKFLEACGL